MLNNLELNQQIQEVEMLIKKTPKLALENAEKLYSDHPKSDPVLMLLARSQRFSGDLEKAKNNLDLLIVNNPLNIIARMELATVLNQKKQFQDAIKLLRETTELVPECHEVWDILSQHLYQSGDHSAASHALAQHEMIKDFNVQLANAKEHFDSNRFEEADTICRQLLKKIPTEVRTLKLLAQISSHFGHFEVSVSILEYCTQQNPNDVAIGIDYANALLSSKRYKESLAESKRLLISAPEDLKLASIQAECSVKLGDYQGAINSYTKLIPVHPRKDLCLLRYGNVLKIIGQSKKSVDSYKKAIEINPEFGEAYWNLANMKTFLFSDEEISAMKHQLQDDLLTNEERIFFNFAMGKALEDKKLFTESFNYYKTANDACFKTNSKIDTKQNDEMKSFFTKDFFEQLGKQGHPTQEPIFIVGLHRSGSTLVEQILASHSLVDGTMELAEIVSIARHLSSPDNRASLDYMHELNKATPHDLNRLGQRYLDHVAVMRQGAPFFTDKLPSNFKHIGLIKSIFPNAKIIDVRRDPMACGFSIYKQYFAEGVDYSYDLESIGKYYNAYLDMMVHWNSVLPGEILTVNYHSLINDLQNTVQSIVDYCGIAFEESCLKFYKNTRAVATISSEQVRKPIYQDGLTHWKNYQQFLLPLEEALKR